jgi:hypothetical protein
LGLNTCCTLLLLLLLLLVVVVVVCTIVLRRLPLLLPTMLTWRVWRLPGCKLLLHCSPVAELQARRQQLQHSLAAGHQAVPKEETQQAASQ